MGINKTSKRASMSLVFLLLKQRHELFGLRIKKKNIDSIFGQMLTDKIVYILEPSTDSYY